MGIKVIGVGQGMVLLYPEEMHFHFRGLGEEMALVGDP